MKVEIHKNILLISFEWIQIHLKCFQIMCNLYNYNSPFYPLISNRKTKVTMFAQLLNMNEVNCSDISGCFKILKQHRCHFVLFIYFNSYFAGYYKCFLINQVIDDITITAFANVESHIICQIHCKDESRCQSFVYSVNAKQCFLKSRKVDNANIPPKKGIISGPKNCQDDYSKGNVKRCTINCFSANIWSHIGSF